MYDIAIIGAGINGSALAYELRDEKKQIVLFDTGGIAAGGSGAAGAFISPKFSKSGELKELLHDAFVYSMRFYKKHFPHIFKEVQLLHIAQNEQDAESLKAYKASTSLKLLEVTQEDREYVSIKAGLVDAKLICEAMAKYAQLKEEEVTSLVYDDGVWIINEAYSAKELVLATGAYKKLIQEPSIELRGVWGHRIDIRTSTKNPYSIHQFVSISPSKNNVLAIGATHNVHYHPQTSQEPYDINAAREELLEKAQRTLKLEDVTVLKDYMGLRSGSFDYLPLVGPLVLSSATLADKSVRLKVKNPDYSKYTYYPNLTMINGSGGYGFVLAPYLAKMLKDYIVSEKKIDERLCPARMFARWAKKN